MFASPHREAYRPSGRVNAGRFIPLALLTFLIAIGIGGLLCVAWHTGTFFLGLTPASSRAWAWAGWSSWRSTRDIAVIPFSRWPWEPRPVRRQFSPRISSTWRSTRDGQPGAGSIALPGSHSVSHSERRHNPAGWQS